MYYLRKYLNCGMRFLLILFALCSCEPIGPMTEDYKIRVIDGCEYLVFEDYSKNITHKGNCKNPIHHD